MITNERQYKITNAQLEKIRKAIESFDSGTVALRVGSRVLAKAELNALKSEMAILQKQLLEYRALKSGSITILKANKLEELPQILIKARIAKGLSQRRLAELLRLKEQQIQRYEAEDYASAKLKRLEQVAAALELNISEIAEFQSSTVSELNPFQDEIEWDMFPIEEMYRRNWFDNFSGTLAAAKTNADTIVKEYVQNAISRSTSAMFRQRIRSSSEPNPYALLAWQCRIISLAKDMPTKGSYQRGVVNKDWLAKLVQKSRFDDGPRRAKEYLESAGIHLVIEPHLSRTHLDGAAFLLPNGKPIIGLTLRYDRLDNFWFVLVHELIHVMKHLRKGEIEDIFDDLDAQPDRFEEETDKLASSVLIDDGVWEVSLARYIRSEDSIKDLAGKLHISPAIIAGRIRKEADNYTILTGLVGQREVRKQFLEVQFA